MNGEQRQNGILSNLKDSVGCLDTILVLCVKRRCDALFVGFVLLAWQPDIEPTKNKECFVRGQIRKEAEERHAQGVFTLKTSCNSCS